MTTSMARTLLAFPILMLVLTMFVGCKTNSTSKTSTDTELKAPLSDSPEYFNLRPKLEKDYGYSHAVKIGNDLKISGVVSMNDSGTIVAPGNMEQQMKNCYSDLQKILQHSDYTYDDVFAEDIYTTNMAAFLKAAGYRNSIYRNHFPTGTWLEVKGLAVDGQLIEIDMEARKRK
jgi:enamine deaminase RidA (YjgF/YER057c/UK114 family)